MLRKVSGSIVLVCILLLTAGCSAINSNSLVTKVRDETGILSSSIDEESIQVMIDIRSFSEFLGRSNCIVIGEYISCEYIEKNTEYEFEIKKVLKGDITENVIRAWQMKGYASVVDSTISFQSGGKIYEEGEEYILVMGKYDYVFLDKPEYRLFVGTPHLPMENLEKSTLYGEPIPDLAEDCSLEHITKLIDQAKDVSDNLPYSFRYSVATDIPTVVEEADIVIKVKILRVTSEAADDRTSYLCSVLKVLKEDSIGKLEGRENLEALLLKGSAKVDEEYILLLNRDDKTSLFLASSRNSVFLSTDEKAVKEIEEAVQKYQELNEYFVACLLWK